MSAGRTGVPNVQLMSGLRPAPVLPDALCALPGIEDWFAEDQAGQLRAVLICHACPELLKCRDWALAEPRLHGVWGGLQEPARRVIRGIMKQQQEERDANR